MNGPRLPLWRSAHRRLPFSRLVRLDAFEAEIASWGKIAAYASLATILTTLSCWWFGAPISLAIIPYTAMAYCIGRSNEAESRLVKELLVRELTVTE